LGKKGHLGGAKTFHEGNIKELRKNSRIQQRTVVGKGEKKKKRNKIRQKKEVQSGGNLEKPKEGRERVTLRKKARRTEKRGKPTQK